jgi:hypothetical protein
MPIGGKHLESGISDPQGYGGYCPLGYWCSNGTKNLNSSSINGKPRACLAGTYGAG